MSHRIELNQLSVGGVVLVAVIAGAGLFFGAGTIGGGTIGSGGNTYSAYVRCGDEPRSKPSLLKGFVGVQDGKRVLVRGFSRSQAESTLRDTYEDCSFSTLTREGKSFWRRS